MQALTTIEYNPKLQRKGNEIKEYLCYDETSPSGLRWIKNSGRGSKIKPGDVAGSLDKGDSYWRLHALGNSFKVHRVVWFLNFGNIPKGLLVDHKNKDRSDNNIENLRLVNTFLSARNKKRFTNCSTKIGNIQYYEGYNKNNTLIRKYVVSVRFNGLLKSRTFSLEKYGKELAFEMALNARKELFKFFNAQGAGFTDDHGLA